MFYFEELKLGKWRPRSAPERPSLVGAEGVRHNIRAITEIPEHFQKLTLGQLFEVFSPDGRFQRTGGAA